MIPGLIICAWVLDSQLRMFHMEKEKQELEQLKKEMENMELTLSRSATFQQPRQDTAKSSASPTDTKVSKATESLLPMQYEKRQDGLDYPIFTPTQEKK